MPTLLKLYSEDKLDKLCVSAFQPIVAVVAKTYVFHGFVRALLRGIDLARRFWRQQWQAWDSKTSTYGSSVYNKKKALFLRTEKNPVIGVTTELSRVLYVARQAGLKVYKSNKADAKAYYFDGGKVKTISESEVNLHATPAPDVLAIKMDGQADKAGSLDLCFGPTIFKQPPRKVKPPVSMKIQWSV